MADTDIISDTTDRITAAGFDPQTASWDHKVCVMLVTAQGVIDNGGFEYFLEMPFDGTPDKQDFPRIYEAVGAAESACAVEEAMARSEAGNPKFDDLNDILWSNSKRNYELLETYVSSRPESYS